MIGIEDLVQNAYVMVCVCVCVFQAIDLPKPHTIEYHTNIHLLIHFIYLFSELGFEPGHCEC